MASSLRRSTTSPADIDDQDEQGGDAEAAAWWAAMSAEYGRGVADGWNLAHLPSTVTGGGEADDQVVGPAAAPRGTALFGLDALDAVTEVLRELVGYDPADDQLCRWVPRDPEDAQDPERIEAWQPAGNVARELLEQATDEVLAAGPVSP